MQCKDIPTLPILEFLESLNGKWGNWCFGNENDVRQAMPPGTPDKIACVKMRNLIKKGIVDGCPCGCRGDYELNEKSRAILAASRS